MKCLITNNKFLIIILITNYFCFFCVCIIDVKTFQNVINLIVGGYYNLSAIKTNVNKSKDIFLRGF